MAGKAVHYGDTIKGEQVTTLESVPYDTPMPLNDPVALEFNWDTGEVTQLSNASGTVTTTSDDVEHLDFSSSAGSISRSSDAGDQWVESFGQDVGLIYSDFGWWFDDSLSDTSTAIFAAAGVETNPAAMPKTGAASFSGTAQGFRAVGGDAYYFSGDVDLTANFGNASVAGGITNALAGGAPFNDIGLNGTITSSGFAGQATTLAAPIGPSVAMGQGVTGSFSGKFYGPAADEVAGTVKIFESNNNSLAASFGAKR